MLALCLLLLTPDVLVVPDDYAQISAAVSAAGQEDTILVRPGSYAGFSVTGKGLAVVAESPGVVIDGYVGINDVPPAQSVVLRGFDVDLMYADPEDGALWIEDVVGDSACGPFGCGSGGHGLTLDSSPATVVARCSFHGAVGGSGSQAGISMRWGKLALFGIGRAGYTGRGVACTSVIPPASYCRSGNGLQYGFQNVPTRVFYAGVDLAPGPSSNVYPYLSGFPVRDIGSGTHTYFVSGPPPAPLSGATSTFIDGRYRELEAPAVVRGGTVADFRFTGYPNESVFLGLSLEPLVWMFPEFHGPLLLQPHVTLVPVGQVAANGALSVSIPTAPMPASLDDLRLYFQAAYVVPAGALRLGGASCSILVHQAIP